MLHQQITLDDEKFGGLALVIYTLDCRERRLQPQ